MRIFDVEVLDVTVEDEDIAERLVSSRQMAIEQILELAERERQMATTLRKEEIKRIIAQATSLTAIEEQRLATTAAVETQDLQRKTLAAEHLRNQEELVSAGSGGRRSTTWRWRTSRPRRKRPGNATNRRWPEQAHLDHVHKATLERTRTEREQEIAMHERDERVGLMVLQAETEALVSKARAIQPDMIAAR